MSNGGMMAHQLACDAADLLRAVARSLARMLVRIASRPVPFLCCTSMP
jgi:poly(3-hydroxybutyrate) depolymerase